MRFCSVLASVFCQCADEGDASKVVVLLFLTDFSPGLAWLIAYRLLRPAKTMSMKCPLTRPRYELHWTCREGCRRSVKDCISRIISFVNPYVRPKADTIVSIGNGSFILQLHVRMIHLAYFMFEKRKILLYILL